MKKKAKIEAILKLLDRDYPEKDSEIVHVNPFQLLIGTMLAAQATDRKVNEISPELFKECPTPEAFVAISLSDLELLIKSINFYKTKAKHIKEACFILVSQFHSQVPQNRDDLMKLPGVGRKTANVVLSYAFGMPAIAVDTHVFRVATRLGLTKEKDPLSTELALERLVPKEWWSKAHSSMVLHGRRVCDAKKPNCPACSLLPYCSFNKGVRS